MSRETPGPTPEEMGEIMDKRTLSDAELIKGGAKRHVTEKKDVMFELTDEQMDGAKKEMRREEEKPKIKAAILETIKEIPDAAYAVALQGIMKELDDYSVKEVRVMLKELEEEEKLESYLRGRNLMYKAPES